MISTTDFDEIVVSNPFLTNGATGYGFRKWFWQFQIHYDPDALQFPGQSNSTCKYIIIENDFSKVLYKIIREDHQVEIQEIFPKNNYTREAVTDPKKLSKIESKFNDLKKVVKKQIKKHRATLKSIQQLKVSFDFDSIQEFLTLFVPKLTPLQQEKLIKELQELQKNPIRYLDEPTDTIGSNSRNIIQSIFFNVIVDQLEKCGGLIIIDYKSPYEEVIGLIAPIFEKLRIPFDERLKKTSKYETTDFINRVNDILIEKDYIALTLGGVSDTYLVAFTQEQDYMELEIKAKKIKVEVRQWKNETPNR